MYDRVEGEVIVNISDLSAETCRRRHKSPTLEEELVPRSSLDRHNNLLISWIPDHIGV